jgi:hypothetical protein
MSFYGYLHLFLRGKATSEKAYKKDIKMISSTNKSVIEKLQFSWISGNTNLNFNLDIIAVLRLAPMTSL